MWVDVHVISVIDSYWGELYRVLGLKVLFKNADISYGFDRRIIDGVVDGSALSVRGIGGVVRKLQTGKIQAYMGFAVLFLVLIVWFIIRGM